MEWCQSYFEQLAYIYVWSLFMQQIFSNAKR